MNFKRNRISSIALGQCSRFLAVVRRPFTDKERKKEKKKKRGKERRFLVVAIVIKLRVPGSLYNLDASVSNLCAVCQPDYQIV